MQKNTIKIAFVGTCCSGKTTLFKYLKKKNEGNRRVCFVSEAARELLKSNPEFLKNRFSARTQRAIQKQIIANEKKARQKRVDLILCDRSVIDPVVYLHSTCIKNEADILLQEALHWIPTYNRILLFDPHDIPYVQDKVRTENPEKRIELHNAYLEFFRENKISFHLLSGTLKKRMRQISRIINGQFPK